jgi:hypothetical protein
MNAIGAVLTGLLLVIGQFSSLVEQHVSAVRRGIAAPLTAAVGGVTTLAERVTLSKGLALGQAPPAFVRLASRGRTLLVPSECRFENNRYDVVVHFHGADSTVDPLFERSQINAVFLIHNWGAGSGAYEDRLSDPRSLDRLLAGIRANVTEHCQNSELVQGRLALSAWSAGYGAVGKVLAREADARRVDSVLLADGLHVGYEQGRRRELNSLQMEPFTLFSYEAAAGEKLMGITHSAIVPPGYASTTQTADYLLRTQGLERSSTRIPTSRPGMVLVSHAEQGSLYVRGYEGADAPAHCHHLYGLGETLLPLLKRRWSQPS